MMLPDKNGLTEVKRLRATAPWTGSLDSWLTADNESGNGSVTAVDASNDGGYVEIDPGTTSSGDRTSLRTSFGVVPNAYDVFEVKARLYHTTGQGDDAGAFVGMLDSSDDDGLQSYVYGGALGRLRSVVGGSTNTVNSPKKTNSAVDLEVSVEWWTTEGFAISYVEGMPSQKTTTLPNDSNTYYPEVEATYEGGSAAQIYVKDFELAFYEHSN